MSYQGGRSIGFRPIGASLAHGMPSDRWFSEQLSDKLKSITDELYSMKQTMMHARVDDVGEFPPLGCVRVPMRPVVSGPGRGLVGGTLPQGPPMHSSLQTLFTQNGEPVFFNPEGPPPIFQMTQNLLPAMSGDVPRRETPRSSDLRLPAMSGDVRRVPADRQPTARTSTEPANSMTFNILTQRLFRFLQLSHHRRNWLSIPGTLNRRVDAFVADINPPLSTDIYRSSLSSAADEFKNTITLTTRNHLETQLRDAEERLKSTAADDFDRAARWATSRLQERLQRRFNFSANATAVRRAKQLTGTIVPSNTLNNAPIIVSTVASNVVSIVAPVVDPISVVGVVVADVVGVDTARIATQPQARTSSSPVLQGAKVLRVGNRFSPLAGFLEDDDIEDDAEQIATGAAARSCQSPKQPRKQINRHAEQIPKFNITFIDDADLNDSAHIDNDSQIAYHGRKTICVDKFDIRLELPTETKVLVIGDSNLRRLDTSVMSEDWHVVCVPGADLALTKLFIDALPDKHSLTDIIVTTGMCNLNDDAVDVSPCLNALDRLKVRKHVLGVSFDERKFTHRQVSLLRELNRLAERETSVNYVPPLDGVKTTADGIHYTGPSMKLITQKLVDHMTPFL